MNTNKINIRKLEADLWESADLLRARSKLISCQYCMPILALLFLRYAYSRYKMVEQKRLTAEFDELSTVPFIEEDEEGNDVKTWGRGMEKVIDACKENDFPSPIAYTQASGLWVVFNYSDTYVNKLNAIDRGEKIWFDPENGMGSGTVNGSLNGN